MWVQTQREVKLKNGPIAHKVDGKLWVGVSGRKFTPGGANGGKDFRRKCFKFLCLSQVFLNLYDSQLRTNNARWKITSSFIWKHLQRVDDFLHVRSLRFIKIVSQKETCDLRRLHLLRWLKEQSNILGNLFVFPGVRWENGKSDFINHSECN